MKRSWLLTFVVLMGTPFSLAVYGPSLQRADLSVSVAACREAEFALGDEVVGALRSGVPAEALAALGGALKEFRDTPAAAKLYPARAFCIHELVPDSIASESQSQASLKAPTVVDGFKSLGIEYFYYEPDGRWTLHDDPVKLEDLASAHLDSRWGREAFLMMMQLGWSEGGCREGPDQFRQVIDHGNKFLLTYPHAEESDRVRLDVADAYATWWNLSRTGGSTGETGREKYQQGAQEAKRSAIELYGLYLSSQRAPVAKVAEQVRLLKENAQGSGTYAYFCPNYED